MARTYQIHLQKLISKYRIMVGNLVYDTEEQRVYDHVAMILEEMKKDKNEIIPDTK